MRFSIQKLCRYAAWITSSMVLAVLILAMTPYLRWIDIHLLDESLKDAWGQLRHSEDWARAAAVPSGLDYRWLEVSSRPILVAHGLGEAGVPGQNSLEALERALKAGFRLLEIDVWLDETGQLRCHHGPELPAEIKPGECTLLTAAHRVAEADAWLVVDIKTDFEATSAAIVKTFNADPSASRLIFQLYRPSDINQFARLASLLSLPGPLVTAYRARRSLSHIAAHMNRLGIRVLTVPLYRGGALPDSLPRTTLLLVHPIHDCQAFGLAGSFKADGFYLHTNMLPYLGKECPPP